MKPAIDVIVNRNARRLRSASELRDVVVAEAHRGGARVYETHSLDELTSAVRDIASRGTDGVLFAGGDGSVMAGLSALARVCPAAMPWPPVAFVPGGTVCTIARNLGMKGRARRWTQRVVHAACAGTTRADPSPTLRVVDDAGGDRVGFIFGAGLVAQFFDVYESAPRQGLGAAAVIAARVFGGSFVGSRLARRVLDPTSCKVSVDDSTHESNVWSLVLASVVRDVGLHFLVTYRAGEETGRFHVVASGLPPRRLGPQMVRVLVGRPLVGEPRVDTLARSLSVAFDPPGGAYVLDGDLLRAPGARVGAGPVVSILSPPP